MATKEANSQNWKRPDEVCIGQDDFLGLLTKLLEFF